MTGWTKLHSRIVVSSIWQQPDHVRILWVTMLAMADADGIVEGSVCGLAKMAKLTPEKTQEALNALMAPDPDSSDRTSGERILETPGGWFIINHANYRDRQTKQQRETAERVRRHRERKRQSDPAIVTSEPVTPGNGRNAPSSSVSVSASEKRTRGKPAAPRPEDVPEEVWTDWLEHRRRKKASVSQTVVDNLRAEGEKVSLRLADVMGMQVTNGWQGFQASWVKRPRPAPPPGSYPNAPGGISSSVVELARKVDEERQRRAGGS